MRRLLPTLVTVVVITSASGVAFAAWNVGGTGTGYARARSMPGGSTPSAAAAVRDVTVSWTPVDFPAGTPVTNYIVRRYHASTGVAQTILSDCAGTVTGTSCVERNVPAGTWRYTVTPVHQNWRGAESATSAPVTVGPPALTLTPPTTVTALPATLTGAVSQFASGQTLSFRLDDPATGTLLSGSSVPATIGPAGAATITVTMPKGVADGAHTLYAIGSQGDVASAPFNVNVPAPKPTSLSVVNAVGQAGRAEQADRVEITFSERLDVSSLCSTWSGDLAYQTITGYNVTVHIDDNAAAYGNDRLRVTTSAGACGGNFRFGSIDLGNSGFVASTTTFTGAAPNDSRVVWDATTFKLTITLGARATGANPARVNSSVTATYSPDPAIANPSGRTVTGTASRTAVQF